jgi:hypothetical protein
MWNALNVFNVTHFSWRQNLLRKIYEELYTNCPLFQSHELLLRENITDVRGYEYYNDKIGGHAIFVENHKEDGVFEITATDIPDVYKLSNGGYLRVRTLKLSRTLRSLGKTFTLKCKQNEDNTWSPVELS